MKMVKKQGKAKDGRGEFGFCDPMYRNIRDNYWNNDGYNKKPRVWYIDIETRVGRSFKHEYHPSDTLKVRSTSGDEYVEKINVLRGLNDVTNIETFDLKENKWIPLQKSRAFIRNVGFPTPQKSLEEVSLIQIYDSVEDVMIVLGLRDWVHQEEYEFDYDVRYIKCNDEMSLFHTYLTVFKSLDPLIIYAWNGKNFDFPYIFNRMKRLGLDTSLLSNYGNTSLKESEYQGRTEFKFMANGHFYLDLMDVYKKFTFKPRPNYTLDTIAEIELKKHKVPHTEYAAFDDFYAGKYLIPEKPTETQKQSKIYQAAVNGDWNEVRERSHSDFVYYGCIDAHLIKELDSKLNYTQLLVMVSEKMGVKIDDAMQTVKPWAHFISNHAMLSNKVMPIDEEHEPPSVVGGYVRQPERGKHRWVISADVNSMYPLLGMVGANMSPETFIPRHKLPSELRDIVMAFFDNQDVAERLELDDHIWEQTVELLQEHNISLGVNGAAFDRTEVGMVPSMILDIYANRKKAKKEQFKHEKGKIMIQEILRARNG